MPYPEIPDDTGQSGVTEGFQCPDMELATEGFILTCQSQLGFRYILNDADSAVQKDPPLSGETHPLSHTVKEPDPQFLLQKADLYRDGGLGISQTGRRFGETLKLGHPDECGQLTQLHNASLLPYR